MNQPSSGEKRVAELDTAQVPKPNFQIMARVLIVAYGNPLRSDDGVAWRAADSLEGKLASSNVEILRTHQLTPEVAEISSRVEAVIFVDAASKDGASRPGEIREAPIVPIKETPSFSHHLSPGAVMALTRDLYGASPHASSVTLTGQCFDHGESLSPVIAATLPAFVARIEGLVQQLLSSKTFPTPCNKP
jgi:hydrogenase maturation protease